jgi:hypothetical protein
MRKPATKQQIATSIGLLAAVIGAGYFWWPHIQFKFQLARNNVQIRRVEVGQLKAPGQTSGWSDCRLGAVSFKLPPDLAEKAERSVDKESKSIFFVATDRQMSVDIPYRVGPEAKAEHERIAAEFHLTPIRLIVASYRAGTDDFGWTMSRAALSRYQTLLRMAALNFPHTSAMAVETRFDGGVEGVLIQRDRHHALFHWQSPAGDVFGLLRFVQEGGLDLNWVRDVCQSVAGDASRLGEQEYSRKELLDLLEAIEIKPSAPVERKESAGDGP